MIERVFSRRPNFRSWLAIQIIAALVILLVPLFVRFGAVLLIERSHWIATGGVAAAYFCTASWVGWKLRRHETFSILSVAGVAGVVFAVFFLFLIARGTGFSRIALVSAVVMAVLALVAPLSRARFLGVSLAVAAASVTVAPGIATSLRSEAASSGFDGLLLTTHYALNLNRFDLPQSQSTATGGAIERFGDGYLVVNGDGDFFYIELPRPDSIDVRRLAIRSPMNADEFDADVAPDVDRLSFRTADLLLIPFEQGVRLLVSHLFWKRDADCYVVRVSESATTRQALIAGSDERKWRTAFETRPCLPLHNSTARPWSDERPFRGLMMGGRLLDLGDGRVMVTIGDFKFDGWNAIQMFSQDTTVDYGKTIVFDLATGESRHFSIGHRNAQGLAADARGRIWSTEHGPKGGDELNLLIEGANYGWPYYTYGAEYTAYEWPLLQSRAAPVGYETPRYAWVPSIGISNLLAVRDTTFPLWQGDLLVSSLKAHSLWRVRLEDDRAVFAEPLPVGVGVRDLVEGADGIVILGDDNSIVSVTPAAPDGGGQVTFGRCVACHEVGPGASQALGPDLAGIVGRDIASASGFNYSSALLALDGPWTEERLDRFIADPAAEVPGTAMEFPGISDPAQRATLIEYLRDLR